MLASRLMPKWAGYEMLPTSQPMRMCESVNASAQGTDAGDDAAGLPHAQGGEGLAR